MPMPILLTASAAALVAASAFPLPNVVQSTAQTAGTTVIATGRDAWLRMTVPVAIASAGSYRFLVDTAAEQTVVSRQLADHLGLEPDGDTMVLNIAGQQQAASAPIPPMTVGRRELTGLSAVILDRADIGADGIIGLDTLQDNIVLIDFRRQVMLVDKSRGRAGQYDFTVRGREIGGQLILSRAWVDGIETRVIIDTGLESSIANNALRAKLKRLHGARVGRLLSVTGQEREADFARVGHVVIDDLAMPEVMLGFADLPVFTRLGLADRPAILIGMRELRRFERVAIDFPHRRVMFKRYS